MLASQTAHSRTTVLLYGSRVFMYSSSGNVSVINCRFQNNNGTNSSGGRVTLKSLSSDASIT